MNRKFFGFLTVLILASGEASSVYAASTVFADRAAWETAAGGAPSIFEDFDSITVDAVLPFDVGPFTLITSETSSIIDAAPFITPSDGVPDDYVVDGTTYFRAQTEIDGPTDEVVIINFDTPVISWGVDLNPHSLDLGD